MTYKEKYSELLEATNIAWNQLMISGHWDKCNTPEHAKALTNWENASINFIEFITRIKRKVVNMYDEMPITSD